MGSLASVGVNPSKLEKDRIVVGGYEFRRSSPKLVTPTRTVSLGNGISCFKDGEYKGYFSMPEEILNMPMQAILQTEEFRERSREYAR